MNVPIDISPGDLETVREILAEHVPEHKVLAFGSRVNWTARQYSDLDLAVMTEKPLNISCISDLSEAFTQSDLPFKVDIADWASTDESFRKIIEKEHAVVQQPLREKSQMADNWCKIKLSDVAKIIMGQSPPSSTYNETGDGLPFFQGVRDFNYRYPLPRVFCSKPSRIAQPGDILFSVRAPIGRVNIADRECATGRGLAIIRPHNKSDARYLEFLLRNMETSWDATEGSGSVFGNATRQDLEMLLLLWPQDKQERNAIAHILGALDDKIELNRQMSETLEAMAQALFKSWFVDFDPVRAKMEERWNRGESLPSLPAHLWDLFPEKLINSRLGKTPEGWEVKTLGDLCYKPQYGYNASAKSEPIGPKFVRITDINKKAWIDWKQVPYCKITEEEFDKYCLHKGDLLIARMADPGHGVMIEEEEEAVFASYLIRFRPIHEFQTRFLQYWFRSDKYWDLVLGRSAGTTRVSLNARVLSEFPLVVPSRSVSEAFEKHINSLRTRVVTNASESSILANIRDKLLPKLLSGRLNFSVLF